MIVPAGSSPFHAMPDEFMPTSVSENMFMYDPLPSAVKEETSTYAAIKDETPTYASMKPVKSTQILCALTSQDDESLTRWTNIYPEHWTTEHILDWLFYVALLPRHKIDFKKFGAEKFQGINGKELCCMSKDQFIERMPEYGHILYEELRLLLSEAEFEGPDMSLVDSGNFNELTFAQINSGNDWMLGAQTYPDQFHAITDGSSTSAVLQMNRLTPVEQCSSTFPIDGYEYDFDPVELRQDEEPMPPSHDDGYVTDYSESDRDSHYNDRYNHYPLHTYTWSEMQPQHSVQADIHSKTKRVPGRPRKYTKSSESSGDDCEMLEAPPTKSSHRGRRQGQSTKGNHLWEFVRDLLKNPEYCNKIIKWEDRKAGVFRFVHSDKVANLWGRKKNNAGMTYEKLSRAMRYYYKREILERVDGRRLVYKFGKNATGWQED